MPAAEHPNLLPSLHLLHGLGSGYAALSASYTHQCASDYCFRRDPHGSPLDCIQPLLQGQLRREADPHQLEETANRKPQAHSLLPRPLKLP